MASEPSTDITSPLTNVTTEHATVTRADGADGTRITAVTPDSGTTGLAPANTSSTAPTATVQPVQSAPATVTNSVVTVQVPYQAPHMRALSTAQRTALASLASAVLVVVLRLLLAFLQSGSYTAAAVQGLGVAIAMGVITTLLTYLQKFSESNSTDAFKLSDAAANADPVTAIHVTTQ